MTDLASLDLKVCAADTRSEEKRFELRVASTDAFVAWFYFNQRVKAGDHSFGTNTELIRRSELSEEQFTAAREWLREQMLSAL